MRAFRARALLLAAMLLCLVIEGAAQTPVTIQVFLPGGALPLREVKVTFLTRDGEKISRTTDAKGALRVPEEVVRARDLTAQVEGDKSAFATTISQIRLEPGASLLPIFLAPLESATFSPGPAAPEIEALDAQAPAEARAARENALKASSEKNPQKAMAEFTRAMTIYPRYLRVINEYGMFQYQRGRLEEAAAAFIQAASMRSRFPFPRLNLALARLRQDLRGDASLILQSLLMDFPDFSRARIPYADLLFSGRQFDEAAGEFRRLTADATLDPAARADAHLKLGLIRQREERYNGAVREYREALAIGKNWPGEWQTRLFLGGTLQELKRLDEAEQEFLKAYALGGKRAIIAQKYLGQIYTEQKKYDQALKAYELFLSNTIDPQENAQIREEIEKVKAAMKKW
ncbi:MAG: tetratricopeptide repeat protein [Blastocatellia bacterium]